MVFVFHSLNVVCYIDGVSYAEPTLHSMNPIWSWCRIFKMYYWVQFGCSLLRIFASTFIRGIGWQFPFLEVSLPDFFFLLELSLPGYCWLHKMSLEMFPHFHFCGKSLRKIVNFLNVWYKSSVMPSGPMRFFVGKFLITDSISLLVTGMLRL